MRRAQQPEDGHQQTKETSLEQNLPTEGTDSANPLTGLLASRTAKHYIPVVKATWSAVLHCSSHSKPAQHPRSHLELLSFKKSTCLTTNLAYFKDFFFFFFRSSYQVGLFCYFMLGPWFWVKFPKVKFWWFTRKNTGLTISQRCWLCNHLSCYLRFLGLDCLLVKGKVSNFLSSSEIL